MRRTDAFSVDEEEWAEESLQAAADLMELASDVHEDPTEDLDLRVVTRGILSMAFALWIRGDDSEASYSPFSSERIGNYSYTKATNLISNRESTGVAAFDTAVSLLSRAYVEGEAPPAMSSETVFDYGYAVDPGVDGNPLLHDPPTSGDPIYHDPGSVGMDP